MKKKKIGICRCLIAFFMVFCSISLTTVHATQVRTGYYNKSYTLGSNQADNLIAVAQAQKGMKKAQLNYSEAWCADFVSDCASLAGISNIIPGNGYCETLYNNIKKKGGKDVSSPQKGDIVFYYCKSCSVHWCHVGIMINSSQSIEGNYGGQVSLVNGWYRDEHNHTLASGVITRKFVRPAYSNSSSSTTTKPFHMNIDSPKAGTSVSSAIIAGGWAIYGNGVTNVVCEINGNTYNCTQNARGDVANVYPGYPTGKEGFTCNIPEYFMRPGTNKITFTAYNGSTVLGSDSRTFEYRLTGTQTISNGLYTIAAAANNNSVLDIKGASTEDSADLMICNRNGGNNQKFDVTYLGNGCYKMIAHHSGKALDVYKGYTDPQTNVLQYSYHGEINQRWIIKSAGNGYYYIISASGGMYMDLPNADTTTGNSIWIYGGNGSVAQKWKFESTTEKIDKYGLTIRNGNGTNTYEYAAGTKIAIKADTPKSGMRFQKWRIRLGDNTKIDNEYSASATLTMPASSSVIEAVYETIPNYTVTFNANGGAVSGNSTKTVTSGEKYGTLPTATKSGYTFDGWYTSVTVGTKITESTTVSLTGNQTLYAHWTPKTYTVAFNANGGTISGNSTRTVKYGTKYGTLPTATKGGYTFDGWYTSATGGTKIMENTLVSITENRTLYAHWNQNMFTLSLYTGKNTQTLTYAVGTKVTITADDKPGSGMIFKEWKCYSLDNLEFENPTSKVTTFIMPARSIMVSAIMQVAPEYTVTFDTMGGKSYGIDESTYIFNMKYGFLPTTKKDGYTFDGWYTAKSGGDRITEDTIVTIDGNHTLYAHWTKSDESMIPPSSETEPSQDENDTETDEEDDESDLGAKFVSGKIRYEVTDEKEAAVIGLKTKQIKKAKIPSVVSYNGRKYNVTEISDYAFRKSSVTEVVIADSVKEIGTSVFLGCKNLAKVTIGINTTKIGTKAFKDCSKLKTIIVKSKKLKRIGKKAFYGISKNAQIKVPAAQYKKYKKLFQGKGQGKKVVLKKYNGK